MGKRPAQKEAYDAGASFDALMASLPNATTKQKGDAFERVALWLLRTDPRFTDLIDPTEVFLWDDWPHRWTNDRGIDIVARDRTGAFWAIQAKGYDKDSGLTLDDLDSFFTMSHTSFALREMGTDAPLDQTFSYRVIISSASAIGRQVEDQIARDKHKNDEVLLRDDLIEAKVTWPTSYTQLDPDQPGEPRRKVADSNDPRKPFQDKACQSVVNHLKKHERATLVMACGTGKTLTALWIAEARKAKRILVLAPSLALIRQITESWADNIADPTASFQTVCSDKSVTQGLVQRRPNSDEIPLSPLELFRNTTDPDEVKRFLSGRGTRVVVCTYQSSGVIQEAQHRGAPAFDLIICDEAHRLATPETGNFTLVLDGDAIRGKRRLHMTATPKTYSIKKRKMAKAGGIDLHSMDDTLKFGEVAYTLDFKTAIDNELLVDYVVMINVIRAGDSNAASRELKQAIDERRRFIFGTSNRSIRKDARKSAQITDAESLAAGIGLIRGMDNEQVQRVISFHSKIENARFFTSDLTVLREWLDEQDAKQGRRPLGRRYALASDYIEGSMRGFERARRLDALKMSDPSTKVVIGNSRCLTEGVDIPAVDGVAFIDPKSSAIDITQAIGRAIRPSPETGKKRGVILLPVVIHEGDDADVAIADSPYTHIRDVLLALREQDPRIAESLDEIRLSPGKRWMTSRISDRVIIEGYEHISPHFAERLEAKIIELTVDSWNRNYDALRDWAESNGGAYVPRDTSHLGCRLDVWVRNQRARRHQLQESQVERLESLDGWTWSIRQGTWEKRFACLVNWQKTYGNATVPKGSSHLGQPLGSWVTAQRAIFHRGKMSSERVDLLASVEGWTWDVRDSRWQEMLECLEAWVREHGHTSVPESISYQGLPLGSWVKRQRQRQKDGLLTEEQTRQLTTLAGWTFEPHQSKWEMLYESAKTWIEDGSPPPAPRGVRSWISRQRKLYSAGTLLPARAHLLDQIAGWSWGPTQERWERHFECLQDWFRKYGHCSIQKEDRHNGIDLGRWVATQRARHKRRQIPDFQVALLESIDGWSWSARAALWDERFLCLTQWAEDRSPQELIRGQEFNGQPLGTWVFTQRRKQQQGSLEQERYARLSSIRGWVW